MTVSTRFSACALACLYPLICQAGTLRDGLYEVAVSLDMGALEDLNARKTAHVCVKTSSTDGAHGLFLLSGLQQLERCPVKNVFETSAKLSFDIICDGIDAGRASATYALEPDAFEGRFSIRMGGKNMTMSEAQSGKRLGECPSASTE
ncbi:DUF3617 domain-containing protein [Hyphomicrobium sp.]|uniref:DUF3617 domain-containing protein n=1 Tax=Hyphomicrobium sp. TaxID=82 RepID=UPI002FE115E1